MKSALAVLVAVVCLAACKKEPKPEPPVPAQTESVPISNDPRQGAAMIGAADRVGDKAGEAAAKREAEAKAALGGQ